MSTQQADKKNIPVAGPSISQKEVDYVTDAVKNAWYENANMYNERFEKAFSKYIGARHALSLPSCTSAIHLALLALGIGPGDEVIVPEITWIATSAPITYTGASPVFADIEKDTWCLSPMSFERNISSKTKAVIPVDLYGNMPDMDAIGEIAKEHGIAIIEDAAQAIGSEYKGVKSGCLGDIGVFSFHGSKTLTTGEGGMLVTNRSDIYEKCLFLRDHGRSKGSRMFWNDEIGYKYKMSGLQAALGLAQLERIEELIRRKKEIFLLYRHELGEIEGISLNTENSITKNTFWMVTIAWEPEIYNITKEEMMAILESENIGCRPFFYPLSMLPAYRQVTKNKDYTKINSIAYRISPYAVNLPCSLNIDMEDIRRVCMCVKDILGKYRI